MFVLFFVKIRWCNDRRATGAGRTQAGCPPQRWLKYSKSGPRGRPPPWPPVAARAPPTLAPFPSRRDRGARRRGNRVRGAAEPRGARPRGTAPGVPGADGGFGRRSRPLQTHVCASKVGRRALGAARLRIRRDVRQGPRCVRALSLDAPRVLDGLIFLRPRFGGRPVSGMATFRLKDASAPRRESGGVGMQLIQSVERTPWCVLVHDGRRRTSVGRVGRLCGRRI